MRPRWSIISSPKDHKSFVEICVGNVNNSISGRYLCNEAKIGDTFLCEMGLGEFTYNSIRDSKNIVGIAGGTGITPFLSMARAINDNILDINLTIIHGINDKDDLILNDEFNKLISDKIKLVHVLNNDGNNWNEEVGFGNDVYFDSACQSIQKHLNSVGVLYPYDKLGIILEILFDFIGQIPGVYLDESDVVIPKQRKENYDD